MAGSSQQLNSSGIVVLLGGVASTLLAWQFGNALLFLIGYILLFGFAFHWLLSRLSIQSLEIEFTPAAERARVYSPFPYSVELRNLRRWLPIQSLELKFVESGRNREHTLRIPHSLGPGQSISIEDQAHFGRRGRQRLILLEASSRFPFALTQSCRPFSQTSPHVSVWPDRVSVPVDVILNWESRQQAGPDLSRPEISNRFDPNRFRDYLPGDSKRRINWKLSAKTSNLIVSDRPNNARSCIWLLIHTHPSLWRRPVDFENGIRLLASAVELGFQRKILAGVGIDVQRIPVRSYSDLVRVLDGISELNWNLKANTAFPSLAPNEYLVRDSRKGPELVGPVDRRLAV